MRRAKVAEGIKALKTDRQEAFLERLFSANDEFSPIPFWFFNDTPDEDKIRAQLKNYSEKGVNGLVLHPRIGLPADLPYLSDGYFKAVRFIVKTAAELGMKIVLYDEGMYPSGSAHGMVVEKNPAFAAKGITLREKNDGGEVLAELSDNRYIIKDFTHGTIRGIHFGEDDGEKCAPPAADILNPEAVKLFISLTHDRYYENLKEYFGSTVIAFFTDEPCPLGRNAGGFREWADGMENEIEEQGGRLEELEALFTGGKNRTTEIYGRLVKKHLRESFYAQISAWCENHGIALMGHPAESDDVEEELYFHIPGQDLIMRRIEPKKGGITGRESVQAKLVADIARHLGRRRNVNECFGVCSRDNIPWYFTGGDMKWYIDWLGVRGVNLFVPHAFYYSVEGKRSGERPPDVGQNNIWWKHYNYFSDYIKRISFLMTDSANCARIAVLCDNNNVPYDEVMPLYENQIEFNYLPIQLLDRGHAENGRFCIGGYSYEIILDFIGAAGKNDNGGVNNSLRGVTVFNSITGVIELNKKRGTDDKACLSAVLCFDLNDKPELQTSLRAAHLKKEGTEYWLLSNEGGEPISTYVKLPSADGAPAAMIDLWSGECLAAVRSADEKMALALAPLETRLIAAGLDYEEMKSKIKPRRFLGDWTQLFELVGKSDNHAEYVYHYSAGQAESDGYFKVRGEEMAECWCNGEFIGASFWNDHCFDIGGRLRRGDNEIRLLFTGSAANIYAGADIYFGLLQE